jgi:hypothetical protein
MHEFYGRVDLVNKLLDEILDLAEELSKGTIDKILGMPDGELGLAFLLGQLPGGTPTQHARSNVLKSMRPQAAV